MDDDLDRRERDTESMVDSRCCGGTGIEGYGLFASLLLSCSIVLTNEREYERSECDSDLETAIEFCLVRSSDEWVD
jgi:hypothetical protein